MRIQRSIYLQIVVACLLIGSGLMLDIQINTELQQIRNESYSYKPDLIVNVTISQSFAIGIPQFDMQKVPQDLKVYEISQQKFINMFETMEKHSNSKQGIQTRNLVQKSIFQCNIKSPSMEIVKTYSAFTLKPSNKFTLNSEQNIIYIHIASRQILYTFDTANMQLNVYHYTSQKLNFLSSAKVNTQNGRQIVMASSSNQEKVYLFSNQSMWSIETKTVLTKVQRLTNGLNGFNTNQYPLDKLYHGSFGYLFGLRRYEAVYLIPEQQNSTNQHITIKQFGGKVLIPQDLYIDGRFLYILDLNQGVYVLRILGDGQIQQYDHIVWQTFGNLKMVAKQSSIFIKYSSQQTQNIVQINYNAEKHEANLVRYYKNDQIINKIYCFNVPVLMSHQSYPLVQPLLFLVSTNGEVQIYPYNIDPRVINTPRNGVKMYIQGVNDIVHLFEDLYVILTQSNLLYVKIKIQKPGLECNMKQSTGHIYYQIQFSSNISSCQAYQTTLQHKSSYNSNCKLTANYIIFIDDPDLSRFQKGILYGVVIMVVASFVIGLMCLIQWRNNKLSLIGRIKDQIIKLRDRYRKMQPFTQQQHEHNKNQVQFELPETLPLPDPNLDPTN